MNLLFFLAMIWMLTQNVVFRANYQKHVRAQSKNPYCSKRDVSTTVDMTYSRFFWNVGLLLC